jgi:hypothetical protein
MKCKMRKGERERKCSVKSIICLYMNYLSENNEKNDNGSRIEVNICWQTKAFKCTQFPECIMFHIVCKLNKSSTTQSCIPNRRSPSAFNVCTRHIFIGNFNICRREIMEFFFLLLFLSQTF